MSKVQIYMNEKPVDEFHLTGKCKACEDEETPMYIHRCPIKNFDDEGEFCCPELCEEYEETDIENGLYVVWYNSPHYDEDNKVLYKLYIPFRWFESEAEAKDFIERYKLKETCICGYTDKKTWDQVYKGRTIAIV